MFARVDVNLSDSSMDAIMEVEPNMNVAADCEDSDGAD
jgi:hypothetical protein